jgi:hypothetical protein
LINISKIQTQAGWFLPRANIGQPNEQKRQGLAVLVGVGCCHEVMIGKSLVKRLAFEATLGALLLLSLQLTDRLLKSLTFCLLPFQILLAAVAAQYVVG